MIIIKNPKILEIIVPILIKSKIDINKEFHIILQNTYTKKYFVIKTSPYDYNDLRVQFVINMPDDFDYGTYDYWIVNDEFNFEYLNPNNIKNSQDNTFNKIVVEHDENLILVGNLLMVCKDFESDVYDDDCNYINTFKIVDDIIITLNIIDRGLLKFQNTIAQNTEPVKYTKENKKDNIYKKYKKYE